jgi:hypothetical protein
LPILGLVIALGVATEQVPALGAPELRHAPARALTASAGDPLAGRAMWIWDLSVTDGGSLSALIADAHRYGIGTVLIKSSDGVDFWSQFSRALVATLHANGLRVCAWQYVYGDHPVTEAYMGAYAVRDGADCLVIDAESEYQGKYISAQTYIARLRALIGPGYPVALAGLPYVDYHPGFPYSVFLGPDGAQYDVPQMYWGLIGVTTDAVFAHTYAFNLVYGRPIEPLGQVFGGVLGHQIVRFRELARAYGAGGVSWFDWDAASPQAWTAVSRPAGTLPGYVPATAMADLGDGAQGDIVVWAQEHLISAGYRIGVNGNFGRETLADIESFQAAHGLGVDGIVGPETWHALLAYRPATIIWTDGGAHTAAVAARSGALVMPVPASARLPGRRDEIAGAPATHAEPSSTAP